MPLQGFRCGEPTLAMAPVTSILQPVQRRRRRRHSRLRPLAVAASLISAAALLSMWLLGSAGPLVGRSAGADSTAGTKRPPVRVVTRHVRRPAAPLRLLTGQPLEHTFSPPLAARAAIVINAS